MSDLNQLLTVADRVMLLVNAINAGDPYPVCKLCTPDGSGTWIIVSVDPEDLDRLFGLYVSASAQSVVDYFKLSEISEQAAKAGLNLLRDDQFIPDRPFSEYVQDANADPPS